MTNPKYLLSIALILLATISNIVVAARSASSYLSANELELVEQMNLARTQPRQYADYLVDLTQYYNGDLNEVPGENAIQTREGIAGIDEAIQFLRTVKAVPALIPSQGMSRAALDHAMDQAGGYEER